MRGNLFVVFGKLFFRSLSTFFFFFSFPSPPKSADPKHLFPFSACHLSAFSNLDSQLDEIRAARQVGGYYGHAPSGPARSSDFRCPGSPKAPGSELDCYPPSPPNLDQAPATSPAMMRRTGSWFSPPQPPFLGLGPVKPKAPR